MERELIDAYKKSVVDVFSSRWVDMARQKLPVSSSLRSYLPFIALAVVLWLTCFSALNNSDLIDAVDEGYYSAMARQMVDTGNWLIPRVGSEMFLGKPPLFFWSQAFFIRLTGPTPLAARLPSALAAALTALALWWWGARNGRPRAGFLAAMFYVLCPLTLGLAQIAMTDSLLTFWLTLATVGWIEAYKGNRRSYLLWAIASGLACMTKGLIGFLLPLGAFVIWLGVRRDTRELRRVPWLAVAGLFFVVILPWHLAAWRSLGGAFVHEYIVREHIERFLGRGYNYASPFWYYLAELPFAMFPWVVFVPAACWRALRDGWRSPRSEMNCATAMWALWALVIVIFFSLSRTKLPQYILPALPAFCMLVALRLETAWQTRRMLSKEEAMGLGLTGFVLGALFVIVFVIGWQLRAPSGAPLLGGTSPGRWLARERESPFLTLLAPQWLWLGTVTLLGTIVMLLSWKAAQRVAAVSILTASILAFILLHLARPVWSQQQIEPMNELGRRALPALQRGEYLVIYEANSPTPYSLSFQLGHPDQIKVVLLRHELPAVLDQLQHGYVLAQRKAIFYPLPMEPRQEATAGSWILWRFDR
jgi:4-amino-4-deoxy-L-arabinose transferase-like glycosyltransferase